MTDNNRQCIDLEKCPFELDIIKLKEEIKQLSELVSTDVLTGLFNYRHFLTALAQEMERSQRTGQPTVLIMADADYFKKVNDNWGHEVGNQALKLIANAITQNIRKLDIACRYGGEEFAIILPSTGMATANQVSERIRKTIEETPLIIPSKDGDITLDLTISIGFSLYSGDLNDNSNKLIERADQQLYRAKQSGRNRVCHDETELGNQQVDDDEKSALFGMFSDKE